MMGVKRRTTAAIAPAAALAVALALSACGGGIKNSNASSSANTGTTAPAAGSQTTSHSSTDTPTTSTTTATTTAPATAAIAQQTVRAPNSKDGTVDIDVLGLAVQGNLATLSVRFTPHFPDKSPGDSISLYDMSDNALDPIDVSLVDPVGLKRYLVVRDSNNDSLGSDEVDTEAVNNSSVIAHYTFAAPPASVTKIDVDLGPFPPFNNVPISR